MKPPSFKPFWYAAASNLVMPGSSLSLLRFPQGAHIRPMDDLMIYALIELGTVAVFIWAATLMVRRKQWGVGLLAMGLCITAFVLTHFVGSWVIETRQLVIGG
jgi:uncharacterized membrane protein YhaH (DUF805 family)